MFEDISRSRYLGPFECRAGQDQMTRDKVQQILSEA